MKKIGIIVEFNPFHNGHKYFIDTIKKENPNCIIIAAMSGNIVQRGEFSINDKFTKAKIAVQNRIDVVVEIPAANVLTSANDFAFSAIKLLNTIGVEKIVFGSESNDLEKLENLAAKLNLITEATIKNAIKTQLSYASAIEKLLKTKIDANDILGISYIRAIKKINPKISFSCIKRINNKTLISASKIRKLILTNKNYFSYIPNKEKNLVINHQIFFDNFIQAIIRSENTPFTNRLKNILRNNTTLTYDKFINLATNKDLHASSLKRKILNLFLNLDLNQQEKYRVLAISNQGKKIIKNNSELTTTFDKVYQNELKISELLSLKYDTMKQKEINEKLFIYKSF